MLVHPGDRGHIPAGCAGSPEWPLYSTASAGTATVLALMWEVTTRKVATRRPLSIERTGRNIRSRCAGRRHRTHRRTGDEAGEFASADGAVCGPPDRWGAHVLAFPRWWTVPEREAIAQLCAFEERALGRAWRAGGRTPGQPSGGAGDGDQHRRRLTIDENPWRGRIVSLLVLAVIAAAAAAAAYFFYFRATPRRR